MPRKRKTSRPRSDKRDSPKARLEHAFPRLRKSTFSITSPEDRKYNCIAWAAGDVRRWWDYRDGYYWPPGATRSRSVTSLVEAYSTIGYERCESDVLEPGWEKVAVYSIGNTWTHAARQLPNGAWTSKLGRHQDITHHTLDGLTGAKYGELHTILRRPKA